MIHFFFYEGDSIASCVTLCNPKTVRPHFQYVARLHVYSSTVRINKRAV